ncbi:FtsX-like permease family protein [Actinoplanes subtropicus]|uniref:FtsX-like permease family protein n=1 Tax=Actinoplanes subtropicus TaxID=543632 RepID=UPI0004C3279A|nr:FtsX-like permease family protein [Actinoplanes subtropicus]
MSRLLARLIAGRDSLVRLAATAGGVALAVVLLLFAAVAYPALHAHDVRAGWLHTTGTDDGRGPLLFRTGLEHYRGQQIVRVDVAGLAAPPGLSRLPGPGQYAVSPALARLLATTPPDQLADRYPGRAVATIGPAGLAGPAQLMIVVGHTPAELATYTGVTSATGFATTPLRHGYNDFLRIMLAIGIVGLLFPVLVFVATATRLAAARREQRLAALRLAGVTLGQAALLSAAEALLSAAAGVGLGFAVFALLRPYAAAVPFDGDDFYPGDLRLTAASGTLIALGVPLLAVGAALLSARRVVSPLGVARQAPRPRPTWRRLVPLGAGVALFAIALPVAVVRAGDRTATALLSASFLVVVAGIVTAGPWLTVLAGRATLRIGRGPAARLAGWRLRDDPAAAFRAISGLILAVFLASLICGVLPSVIGGQSRKSLPQPDGTVLAYLGGRQATGLPAARARQLLDDLRKQPGVRRTSTMRRLPDAWARSWPGGGEPPAPVAMTCADLAATGYATCPTWAPVIAADLHRIGADPRPVRPLARPLTPEDLAGLPLAALMVTTDGRAASEERARTAILSAAGGLDAWAETTADADAQLNHRLIALQRLVTVALLLTLLIAGCGLAISGAGGLVERRRPFALLRLAGARPADLRRVLLAELATPLLTIALVSAALGLALAALVVHATGTAWRPPDPAYWAALGGGVLVAAALSAAIAFPLSGRLTAPATVRFE